MDTVPALSVPLLPGHHQFMSDLCVKYCQQATVSGSRGICSHDLNGEETAEAVKQEGAAYPHQQAKTNLRGPFKARR